MSSITLEPGFWSFVNAHRNDDVSKLRLKFAPAAGDTIDLSLTHIQCLQKAGKKFITPDGFSVAPKLMLAPLSIEQASSGVIAAFHASLVPKGGMVLDMTCGLGVDSKAFAELADCNVTACELNPLYADVAEYNFAENKNVTVIKGDSIEYLKSCNKHFDVIFIDPARRDARGGRVYNIHDCTPDVSELLPLMIRHTDKVIAKLSPMLDISQTIRDLTPTDIYSVQGDNGECKEVLAVIVKDNADTETNIHIYYDNHFFNFKRSEENTATPIFGTPEIGQYLYEPYAATMKAAPFTILSSKFGLTKLHQNTHLYAGNSIIENFPGKFYKIIDIINFSSSEIKSVAKKYPRLNVATRNFILSSEELTKKLKVKTGGNLKTFGVTVNDGTKKLIITLM